MFFIFGLIYGMMIACLSNDGTVDKCGIFVKKFIKNRMTQPVISTCLSTFLNYFLFILFFFMLGFIPVAQPVCCITLIFYGLGIGVSTAYLIFFRGLYGCLIFIFMILPCLFVATIVLILSCKESFRFCNKNFAKLFLKKQNLNYKYEFKTYLIKFLTLLLFQLFAAFVDFIFTFFLIRIC